MHVCVAAACLAAAPLVVANGRRPLSPLPRSLPPSSSHLLACAPASAKAYSATTVLPAEVWAATNTCTPHRRVWRGPVGLRGTELSWVKLGWVELSWVELQLNRVEPG